MNPMSTGKNKNLMIGVVIVILVIGLVGFVKMRRNSGNNAGTGSTEEFLPNTEALPTVDASVIVNLKADKLKHEVTISITGIPQDTTNIDYEMSYLAEGSLPKGVIGTIDTEGKSSVEKAGITLGTCSSGACSYDKGVKTIKLSLKFNSASGAKIFEKEFEI